MPLSLGKSKKAFSKNVETEMKSGKPQDQALAIAYSMKKRKKMAKGGRIQSDMDHGSRMGPEGYSKYQEQAQNQKGVHTPVSGVTGYPGGKGTSEAGDLAKDRYAGKSILNEHAKNKHREKLDEMRKMPKPKLQGLYDGGMVHEDGNGGDQLRKNSGDKPPRNDNWTSSVTVTQAQKPSITKLSRPKLANGILKVRDRDDAAQEEDMMNSMHPDEYGKQPSRHLDDESADRQGPTTPSLRMRMMAEGGEIEMSQKPAPKPAKPVGNTLDYKELRRQYIEKNRKKYAEGGHVDMEVGQGPEEDNDEHPDGLESDDDMMSPAHDEYMADHFAEGGEMDDMDQPEAEAEDEHHDSLVASIMAKRKAKMMAEGGQIDLDQNAEEQPNDYYHRNREILKENYDSDMDSVSDPMDSDMHGDDIDSDEHDMISSIRRKMKAKGFR